MIEHTKTNPFPGLRPFQFSEKEFFFGRERQSRELLRKLRRNRFVAVVGTSGSGKSSLVRAGLLPMLAQEVTGVAGNRWRVALFRPGKDPIHNLAEALASPEAFDSAQNENGHVSTSANPDSSELRVAVVETTLRRSALGLSECATRSSESENLLICVDQFEELFRFKEQSQLSNPDDDAAAFVKLLLQSARDKSVTVYVLLTMRSDFLGECAQFRDLPEAINEGQYLIPRLTRDDQRDAITEPASLRGVELTPRLIQRLLNDVGDNPDQLPLLQHALMRTWDHWVSTDDGEDIDLDDYQAVGGMQKALSNHAQQTFEALPNDGRSREIAQKLFKALTETVVNNKEIRRPVELSEICGIANAEPAQVIPVINHFRDLGRCFLMPPIDTELEADTIIDISHESLIKGWDLLKTWVEEEAKSKAIYQRVADAARRRYREGGIAGLWRDPDLKFALEWRDREQPNAAWASRYDLGFPEALAFLNESAEEQRKEREQKEAQLREERERKEREQQRELAAAQAAALTQQQIAEAERHRAEAARGREIAERERAEEAQRREDAERARAEAERVRAEQQFQAALRLQKAAMRLRIAIALLVVMLTITGVFYAKARSSAAEQKKLANELKDTQSQLEKKLEETDLQSKLRQEALVAARKAEADAEKQRSIVDQKARDLQVAVDNLEHEKAQTAKAKEREDAELRGLIALEKGNAAEAVRMFTKLRDEYAKDPHGKINWSWASYNLGTAFRQGKDYDNAVTSYRGALETQKAMYGRASPEIVPALHRLSQVYYEQNNYKESENAYAELSPVLALLAGSQQFRELIAAVNKEMAKLFHDQARDLDIDARQKQDEIFILSESFGVTNPTGPTPAEKENERRVTKLRVEVKALEAAAAEKYKEAGQMYESIVANRESFLPVVHPDLIEAYSNLAAFEQDRFGRENDVDFSNIDDDGDDDPSETPTVETNRAKDLYRLARVIRENRLNPKSSDVAEAAKIENIVVAYASLKRYEPAIRLLRRSIEIRRILASSEVEGRMPTGSSSLSLINALAMLVNLQVESNQEEQSKVTVEEVLRILKAVGKSVPSSLVLEYSEYDASSLAHFLAEKERYEEAQQVLELVIDIQRKIQLSATTSPGYGRDPSDLADDFVLLGIIKFRQKNFSGAEQSLNEGLAFIKSNFAADTELDFRASLTLARMYVEQGRDDAALPLLQRTESIFKTKMGPNERTQRPTGGRRPKIEIQISKSSYLLPGPLPYLDALLGIAEIYTRRGQLTEARYTYHELLAASKWVVENTDAIMPSFSLSTTPGTGGKFKNEYENKYADALESYAAFLKRADVNDAKEAQKAEEQSKEIRRRLGPKKPNPLW